MTVNIWESYMSTADKDVNMKAIFVLMFITAKIAFIFMKFIVKRYLGQNLIDLSWKMYCLAGRNDSTLPTASEK